MFAMTPTYMDKDIAQANIKDHIHGELLPAMWCREYDKEIVVLTNGAAAVDTEIPLECTRSVHVKHRNDPFNCREEKAYQR